MVVWLSWFPGVHYDDCDDAYDTGGYGQLSKNVMAKHKVAISCSRDHAYTLRDGRFMQEIEYREVSEELNSCTPNRKMLIVSRW